LQTVISTEFLCLGFHSSSAPRRFERLRQQLRLCRREVVALAEAPRVLGGIAVETVLVGLSERRYMSRWSIRPHETQIVIVLEESTIVAFRFAAFVAVVVVLLDCR
jgi:hypothetical protein